MSNWAEYGLPCPKCTSSDAYSIDVEGHGHCFSCGHHVFPDALEEDDEIENTLDHTPKLELTKKAYVEPEGEVTYGFSRLRGISAKTREFYNVHTKFVDNTPISVGYPYDNGSYKIRRLNVPKREAFSSYGPIGDSHLFGKDKYPPGSRDSITITEGEEDAMAGSDMIGYRSAFVSVKNAQTALGDVKAEREYINSFKKIILCLDNDKPGQEATKLITNSGLFDYEKLYKVTMADHKDANEYLEKGHADEFKRAWENVKRFTPDAIINSFEDIKAALAKRNDAPIGNYPFSDLSESLRGLHRGEFVLLKGLEKRGKTEVCRALVHELLKNTTTRVATVFLEEDEGTTIKGVATYELEVPCALEESGVSEDDIFNGYARALGDDPSRLYIHTHFASEDENEIIDNIRFLVTVAGVDVVFLDNLTMLVTGREGEDERLRIDRIIRRLRDLVNELHFCLFLVAHVNDTGQTRGSRLPDKLANTIIHMERDLTSPIITERNMIKFFIEGARTQGTRSGPAGGAYFDPISFKLRDVHATVTLPELT